MNVNSNYSDYSDYQQNLNGFDNNNPKPLLDAYKKTIDDIWNDPNLSLEEKRQKGKDFLKTLRDPIDRIERESEEDPSFKESLESIKRNLSEVENYMLSKEGAETGSSQPVSEHFPRPFGM